MRKARRTEVALRNQLTLLRKDSPQHKTAKIIFRYWVQRCGKDTARTTFGEKREKAVVARLNEGHEPSYICRAIDGAAEGAWVSPETGRRYDDLELICRNESKLEGFHELAENIKAATLLGPAWRAVIDGNKQSHERADLIIYPASGESKHDKEEQ